MPVRILLADDHAVFRSGLKALLEQEDDLVVVAEAGTGNEAVKAGSSPDVDLAILDLSMPGMRGTVVAQILLERRPELPIIVLTMHEDAFYLRELFKAGVRAFVLKKSTGTDLLQAIQLVREGKQYVDPALAGSVISSYVGGKTHESKQGDLSLLTPREQEVCKLLAYGHTNAEIADVLHISRRTVESHRTSITGKLGVKGRVGLVRFAIEHGLMTLE